MKNTLIPSVAQDLLKGVVNLAGKYNRFLDSTNLNIYKNTKEPCNGDYTERKLRHHLFEN
jgi:hypothetical protein